MNTASERIAELEREVIELKAKLQLLNERPQNVVHHVHNHYAPPAPLFVTQRIEQSPGVRPALPPIITCNVNPLARHQ